MTDKEPIWREDEDFRLLIMNKAKNEMRWNRMTGKEQIIALDAMNATIRVIKRIIGIRNYKKLIRGA